jgi:3-hydroxybutyryl-CoA dehydratase
VKTFCFLVTKDDVERYGEASGDKNPIHFDLLAAQKYGFPDRVAHGMLSMGKLWSVLSRNLLSPRAFPLQYDIKFLAPVFVGSCVTVNAIKKEENKWTIEGFCEAKPVLKGTLVFQKM